MLAMMAVIMMTASQRVAAEWTTTSAASSRRKVIFEKTNRLINRGDDINSYSQQMFMLLTAKATREINSHGYS